MRGIFKMTFLPHVTVVHGVGYGGGSLVYANTLPGPQGPFLPGSVVERSSADWKAELGPHYATAQPMLGSTRNPNTTYLDTVIQDVARDIGRPDSFKITDVAVYFGEPGKTVPDPYFDGKGPDRTGCIACGACMTGCRYDAKNTLDKNYLYLAEKRGLEVETETEVTAVPPARRRRRIPGRGARAACLQRPSRRCGGFEAKNVIFAGGVLGTVELMLRLKAEYRRACRASPTSRAHGAHQLGVAFIEVVSERRDNDMSKGIAISSILETDEHSAHRADPLRRGLRASSACWRRRTSPAPRSGLRMANLVRTTLSHPIQVFQGGDGALDFSKFSVILLYMRTLEGSIRMKLGRGLTTGLQRRE